MFLKNVVTLVTGTNENQHEQWSRQQSYIIESFELEETFKGHFVQLPCNKQGHLQLNQVAQCLIQPDLDCLQGLDIHHIFGQPVQYASVIREV